MDWHTRAPMGMAMVGLVGQALIPGAEAAEVDEENWRKRRNRRKPTVIAHFYPNEFCRYVEHICLVLPVSLLGHLPIFYQSPLKL